MRSVSIIGIGATTFGRHKETPVDALDPPPRLGAPVALIRWSSAIPVFAPAPP